MSPACTETGDRVRGRLVRRGSRVTTTRAIADEGGGVADQSMDQSAWPLLVAYQYCTRSILVINHNIGTRTLW